MWKVIAYLFFHNYLFGVILPVLGIREEKYVSWVPLLFLFLPPLLKSTYKLQGPHISCDPHFDFNSFINSFLYLNSRL